MLNIGRILHQDRLLRATTGLNRRAFETLLEKFEQVYRKARLQSIREKLFYILFYLKCYPTFDLAAVLFDFDRSQANRWVHRLQPILEKVLGEKKVLPLRKIESIEEFIQHFPEVKEVIVEGTFIPIARPKDAEKQKENYSGKKKRCTRKNLAASAEDKRILPMIKRYKIKKT
ncbi:MAG: transposase [Microcystis sp. 53602_E8]|nr:transposase [Microcystis sp. 53602_E8]